MQKILKKFRIVMILLGLEVFTYFKFEVQRLDVFFFAWSAIFFFVLIYNVFNIQSNSSTPILGGNSQQNYANLAGALSEKFNDSDSKNKNSGSNVNFLSITYLLLLIINVLGLVISS